MSAREHFSPEDLDAIADLISAIESRTDAELVPVVAGASGRYQRAEDSFGAALGVVLVTVSWVLFQGVDATAAGGPPQPTLGLLPVLLLFLGGLTAGSRLARRWTALRRPFVTRRDMRDEVERAASAAFHACRVRSARGRGVLLYVSLYERRVRVMADDELAARIPGGQWERIASLVADGLSVSNPRDAVIAGLRSLGTLLEAEFPHRPGTSSAVADVLRIVD